MSILYSAAVIKAILDDKAESLQMLYAGVERAIKVSEDAKDRSDLPELFRKVLYSCAGNLYPMLELAEARRRGEINLTALWDMDNYFLPEEIMGMILKKLGSFAGPTEIKQALARNGYLEVQGQERVYFTQKVILGKSSVRYYKLRRDCIDRVGEIPLIMIVEMEGDKNAGVRN